ncbi:hypothetical protein [Methylobacterium sp. Leaf91]|uniref:hypothetical protein n=1 Tax=Methylobacterium sp. Leaf91 TaxID=1736247 RepID=UPI00070232EB|nr:hypothetical protein [Methylobacterium sp. Leaf91]KQO91405.1 hypothetical protein ASF32_22625 [Methylobacterium sp. Leaf91]
MEEILASIRRIIADDRIAKAEVVPWQAPASMPENDDVLDLAEVAQPVPIDEPEIAFRKESIKDG